MEKICGKCQTNKLIEHFYKDKSKRYGINSKCIECCKSKENKEIKKQWAKKYYELNINHINILRKKNYPKIKEMINQRKNNDLNFKIKCILRNQLHKSLTNESISDLKYLGCNIEFLKKWIEYRFDNIMNWENFGSYWEIDHIIPISKFDNIALCFHWTNLQPLTVSENRSKKDKILLHYYFNNIININRFNKKYNQFLGYQTVKETLQWLRIELRYGKNAPYDGGKTPEIDNPQPSS